MQGKITVKRRHEGGEPTRQYDRWWRESQRAEGPQENSILCNKLVFRPNAGPSGRDSSTGPVCGRHRGFGIHREERGDKQEDEIKDKNRTSGDAWVQGQA